MVGCLANPQLRFAVAADRCSEHLFRSFVFEVELRKRGKKEDTAILARLRCCGRLRHLESGRILAGVSAGATSRCSRKGGSPNNSAEAL